jgi:hypothetical protein
VPLRDVVCPEDEAASAITHKAWRRAVCSTIAEKGAVEMDEQAPLELTVRIQADEDPERLDQLTAQLRRTLLAETDAERVDRPEGVSVPGTKGDLVEAATLIVRVADNPATISAIAGVVTSWIASRRGSATIEIAGDKLELAGARVDQQDALIRIFAERVARSRR